MSLEPAQILIVGAYTLFIVAVLPVRLLRARLRLRRVAEQTGPDPRHEPQSAEKLDPAALAHLDGGPRRVGEVAVVSALLDGRITPYGAPPGHVRRVGPEQHPSDNAVSAPLMRAFRTSDSGGTPRTVLVRDLVDVVRNSSVNDRIAAGLASRGYTATGPGTERVRDTLDGGHGCAMLWTVVSMALLFAGAGEVWGDEDIDGAVFLAGIIGEVVAIGTLLAAPNAEHVHRYTETPAAQQLLRRARADYRDIAGRRAERPWGRAEVLWHTAVTGFRGLHGMHRPVLSSRPVAQGVDGPGTGTGAVHGAQRDVGYGHLGALPAAYERVGRAGPGDPGERDHGQEQVVALRVGPYTPDLLWGVAGAGLARDPEGGRRRGKHSFEVEIDGVRWDEPFGGGFGDVADGGGSDGDGGGDGGGGE